MFSTEETNIGGKVYNSSNQTFSDPTDNLIGVEASKPTLRDIFMENTKEDNIVYINDKEYNADNF